ncbi:3-oxoacyl-[acyl-carrier-protein] synthase 2 [Acididesulfobacillus acetoxydans]|uniref:3-oxoacyl-[acyl-carrier-protein] synthase 2 n=1 Tax=Acididesulfobacillus acetoxydans TaxID=1561005 RepID=A0A8S0WQM3_9FIRM|nr:beta-ketoacyl-ACP synthase II [Acididesulfobacillus acetoxydans]CAA7602724.1 3-oxoacyl-[acyl-carrier-protein] synthase 2 [Acididesulfobacillus acetoxydans]CEJ06419.1 3-oxoacyl-[acyl-carrier-protein] synthase 2 [Acididesulfobacillus acetoxydans]
MKRRAVITGMGVISPVGSSLEEFWTGLVEGKSGIGPVTRFDVSALPTQVAGEVKDFQPENWLDRKESRHMDRFAQFAVAAAKMALKDADLPPEGLDKERAGVVLGCGIGGVITFEEQKEVLMKKGPGRVSPFFVPMLISNMAAGHLSLAFGLRGPSLTVVTACASATNAIGEALRIIQRGEADVVLCGGTEAPITELAFAGFCSMKAMSTEKGNPAEVCRPFDKRRSGFVIGEGAGILVLEAAEHAEARRARVYAELCGYGSSSDAYHITAPAPGGTGAAKAMALALQDAELTAREVDYINAHGTGTDANDLTETQAIKSVFGASAYSVPVSSTKSMTGHLMGATGAVEAIASALVIERGIIPPTINYGEPDPECDLDYVPNVARVKKVAVAMSNTFGFGGHNATIVLKKFAQR